MSILLKDIVIIPKTLRKMAAKPPDEACILFRRSGPNHWHIMGVFFDQNGVSGRDFAIAAAIDDTYFIVEILANVLLPEKVTDHVVSFCPKPEIRRKE